MILADVVKLSKSPSQKVPNHLKGDHQSLLEQRSRVFDSVSKTQDTISNIERRNSLNIHQNQFLRNRIDFFYKMGTLPTDLQLDKNDPLSLAAKSPRIELHELRKTAETLDFVLIPFEYMRSEAYESEANNIKNAINKFDQEMSRIGSVYALCPTNCYDVFKHVFAKKDKPIFGSPKNHYLQAITSMLPIHRVAFAAIAELQKQFDKLKGGTESLAQTFADQMDAISHEFSRRIDEVASQNRLRVAERIQRRESNASLSNEQATLNLQQLASSIKGFTSGVFEPLMFMVPRDVDIASGNANCIVGPAWGPDFDDIAFTIFGLKKIEGQRELILKEAEKWNF